MASGKSNGQWNVGLSNSQNLFLSAEKFQFKVNASGKSMQAKQIWSLEKLDDVNFALKSWLGRYLGCDKNGKITAEGEEVGAENTFSFVTPELGGDERFVLKSSQGHFIGGSLDNLAGKLRETNPEGWAVHLAIVPQINLRNILRKAFARSSGKEFVVKDEIPWGKDCILFLQCRSGKYCFQDVNSQYLCKDGSLRANCDDDCLFLLIFKQASVAFRDLEGKFLSCIGPMAVLQSKKDVIGQPELFEIHNAKPQVSFMAFNQKYLSNKQGTDVRANQYDVEDTEMFQLEAVNSSDKSGNVKWGLLGANKQYWTVEGNSLACSSQNNTAETAQFEIVWKDDKILLRCSNGKFLNSKSGGQLSPNSSNEDDESCQFVLQMVNRPLIAFYGSYGFVGVKGASGVLECNRSQAEFFQLTSIDSRYYIQVNGKYWDIDANDTISAKNDKPVIFSIEFRAHNKVCIVAPNGQYLRGSQNGGFTASGGRKVEDTTLWTI